MTHFTEHNIKWLAAIKKGDRALNNQKIILEVVN